MTRRRNTINIYDYPEHLNPFREDADDSNEKFSTTGRRRSSFRVNDWNVFSPNKGKSKLSDDINPVSSSATSRFMIWTPKLLRKASFRRSSPPSRPAQPLGLRESQSLISSRLSFRSTTSQSSRPPSSSRTTLHSSCSQSTLPPNETRHTFSSSRPTSPPSRPAPPNARTSLSPSRPLSPLLITPAVTPSTENAPNNVNTGSRQVTPVPAIRKASLPASPSEKTVGAQPSEDETKYTQQGAKPKKKRRAPAPPTPSPGKSTSDHRQANSYESDASMTSSVTSSSAEEPPPHEQSAAATSDLDVIAQEPELGPRNGESHAHVTKEPEPAGKQILSSQNRLPEHNSENGAKERPPKTTYKETQELEHTHENGLDESGDQIGDGKQIVRKDDGTTLEENEAIKHLKLDDYPSYKSKSGTQKLLQTSENKLQENLNQSKDGNTSRQQEWRIRNVKRSPENVITEHRKQLEDSAQNSDIIDPPTESAYRLYNGKNYSSENVGLQNGEKFNVENINISKQLTPEPKPRTILPHDRELKETIC